MSHDTFADKEAEENARTDDELVRLIAGRELTEAEKQDPLVSGALLMTVTVRAALLGHQDKLVAKIPWSEVFEGLLAVVSRPAPPPGDDVEVSPQERLFGQELTAIDLAALPVWCAATFEPRVVYTLIDILRSAGIAEKELDRLRWQPVFATTLEVFEEIDAAGSLARWREQEEQEGQEG
jgi:hypothetical protein